MWHLIAKPAVNNPQRPLVVSRSNPADPPVHCEVDTSAGGIANQEAVVEQREKVVGPHVGDVGRAGRYCSM